MTLSGVGAAPVSDIGAGCEYDGDQEGGSTPGREPSRAGVSSVPPMGPRGQGAG